MKSSASYEVKSLSRDAVNLIFCSKQNLPISPVKDELNLVWKGRRQTLAGFKVPPDGASTEKHHTQDEYQVSHQIRSRCFMGASE